MESSAKSGETKPTDPNRANYSDPSAPGIAAIVQRNIAALIEQRRREDAARRTEERLADAISCFTGSMKFVYLHLVLFGGWIVINLKWTPFPKFDPSFVILAMAAS